MPILEKEERSNINNLSFYLKMLEKYIYYIKTQEEKNNKCEWKAKEK